MEYAEPGLSGEQRPDNRLGQPPHDVLLNKELMDPLRLRLARDVVTDLGIHVYIGIGPQKLEDLANFLLGRFSWSSVKTTLTELKLFIKAFTESW